MSGLCLANVTQSRSTASTGMVLPAWGSRRMSAKRSRSSWRRIEEKAGLHNAAKAFWAAASASKAEM
ncbi:uncharacterized protein EAE98_007214 [Botrytis deweyae]|uniref:Uncharacterized protein n=1 Tax=Botrytis deweyae TaxID=2478750 RepID=A0ABQ7IID6_9HELO|nr:uncharacterized protein EAE98_007214 [Botrytis deweyae]KAF7923342.1 hypothetical protein EAE99_007039 [Botrytis elliptica]KAF7925126.1 hypothetical protein EAE98_007214 [Botrytis deweyae]